MESFRVEGLDELPDGQTRSVELLVSTSSMGDVIVARIPGTEGVATNVPYACAGGTRVG